MPRTSKPRDNYRHDAIVINRIVSAIEQDTIHGDLWRETVLSSLKKAMSLMLQPDLIELEAGKGNHPSRRAATR